MAWNGEVPLLGFEDEHHDTMWKKEILHVRVRNYGFVDVYAWHANQPKGEGYNVFFPNDKCPVKQEVVQARSPFDAKVVIHDYLNRVDHFITHGEIT